MPVLVSVRQVGGKFVCYLAGQKVGEWEDRRVATAWASDELRTERRRISPRSEITGSDVAAYRADAGAQAVTVDGAEWRFA